jgi:hypothetical protein
MPFADKFRAMMALPFPGDTLGDSSDGLTVESIAVGHEGRAAGLYAYPLRLVLRGPDGLAAVKRALRALFARRCTTFSGYGTPYQLWLGKPAIELLDDGRYVVTAEGAGARVHLEDDLLRFCEHLAREGLLAASPEERAVLVAAYLDGYRAEVQRLVGRYKTRLRRSEAG